MGDFDFLKGTSLGGWDFSALDITESGLTCFPDRPRVQGVLSARAAAPVLSASVYLNPQKCPLKLGCWVSKNMGAFFHGLRVQVDSL